MEYVSLLCGIIVILAILVVLATLRMSGEISDMENDGEW